MTQTPLIDTAAPRIVLVAITRHGAALAARLARQMPQASLCVAARFADAMQGLPHPLRAYDGALKDQIGPLFETCDQIVFFVSLGAVVRLIAPHLRSKDEDPGVLVVDDAGQFVIPVLSGHVGGANAMAETVAALLGATAVLTTASDVGQTIPVDILGRELGWTVEAPKLNVTRVSAAVVNGEPVALVQEAGSPHWWTRRSPLPGSIHRYERLEAVDLTSYRAVLWVTHRPVSEALWQTLRERLVVYRPPRSTEGDAVRVALGIGCDRGTPLATLRLAVEQALARAPARWDQVAAVGSITLKADEPALLAMAAERGWRIAFYPPEQLAAVTVPNPSETVRRHTGTPSVSEAAALLAAGARDATHLLVEKHRCRLGDGRNATVSVARLSGATNDEH